jgi:hypothetical protein
MLIANQEGVGDGTNVVCFQGSGRPAAGTVFHRAWLVADKGLMPHA